MFLISMVLLGTFIQTIAFYELPKLIRKVTARTHRSRLYVFLVFIGFFICGYIGFILYLLVAEPIIQNFYYLIAFVFLFGAVFVLLVVDSFSKIIINEVDNAQKIKETSENLKKQNLILKQNEEEMLKLKVKLELKNEELEQTLENFYTLRLEMEKRGDDEKIRQENEKLKIKLEAAKHNEHMA